jgi:hypothetical protein
LRSGRYDPGLAPVNQAQAGPIMIRRIDILLAEACETRATMAASYQADGE